MGDTAEARLNMVESQVRTADVTDLRIQDAMRRIPRESFLPEDKAFMAYADMEPEYAPGLRLLRPRDVAKLVQLAAPVAGETALAIAAPYAAARLEACDVTVVRHDGDPAGALPTGPFDILVCEGAVVRAPEAGPACAGGPGGLERAERPRRPRNHPGPDTRRDRPAHRI